MRIAAVAVLVLAALSFASASMILATGKNRPDDPNQFLPYAVGTLLVPMVLLIVGVWLWGKGGPKPPPAQQPPFAG